MSNNDTARKSTKDTETKVSSPFGQRWSHDHSCEQVLANVCFCYRVHTFQESNGWRGVEWQMLSFPFSLSFFSQSLRNVTPHFVLQLTTPALEGALSTPHINPRKSDPFGTIAVVTSICKHPQLLFKTPNIHSSV